jgi:3-oxoacyl-[acyl-carrier protein] reductase
MHPELEQAFDLSGRVAVVTGAGGGIGRQCAVTLAQAGADVVIADVKEAGLAETARLVEALDRRALVAPTDMRRRQSVDDLAARAIAELGHIDIWANVAAIIRYGSVVDTSDDDLDDVIDVNIKGVYYGCAAAARAMVPRGKGSIINFASAGMDMPAPGISCYALSKAAVAMLTRTLAIEIGAAGVRVNTVAPGWVPTPMTSVYWINDDGTEDDTRRSAIVEQRAGMAPLKMVGEPVDMAWAVLYLASDASRFVTGQVMRPNGGVTMP